MLWSVASLAVLALLWTLAVGWVLPRVLQPRLEAAASSALGAPFTIGRLEIAPWRLAAVASDLRLGPAASPWLRVARVEADASSVSLLRLAPVLERVRIEGPAISIERLAPGRFNVSPLLEALARRRSAPEDEKPQRFALHNLSLEGGTIRFADRVAQSEHAVEALQIGVPFLSNLPADIAIDVEPLLAARIDGSPLRLSGRTQPFNEGRRSSLDIEWRDVDLPRWLEALGPWLPPALPVELQRGRLATALRVVFEQRDRGLLPLLRIDGRLALTEIEARLPALGLGLVSPRLELEGLELRPLERRATLAKIRWPGPAFELNLPTLVGREPDPGAAASAPSTPPRKGGWQWRVGAFELTEGLVRLRDPAWPDGRDLTPLGLQIQGLESGADAPDARLALALSEAEGTRLTVEGGLSPARRTAQLKLDLAGLRLPPWLAPWQAGLPVRLLDGALSLQAALDGRASGWSVRDGALRLDALRLEPVGAATAASAGAAQEPRPVARRRAAGPAAGAPADRLALAALEAGGVQVEGRTGEVPVVRVARLALEGLEAQATRQAGGGFAWLGSPAAEDGAAERSVGAAAPPPSPRVGARAAPDWRINELRCSACSLAVHDASLRPATAFGLEDVRLVLRELGADPAQAIGFELAGRSLGGGRLKASGLARPQPLDVRGRLDVEALDLRGLQPYLEPYLNVALASARAHAAGELRVEGDARHSVASARWRGRLALADVRALDRQNDTDLLRWRSVRLDGSDLRWTPSRVDADLGDVAVDGFFGRLIIHPDGRLNLQDIVRREGETGERSITTPSQAADAPEPGAGAAASMGHAASAPPGEIVEPKPAEAATAPGPHLRWRAIRVADSAVDFTDHFIRPHYDARLVDLHGEVAGLAWDDPQPAAVQLSGKVDGSAPLEVSGTVHPLGPRLATDITASARGIDITRLSGYAGRYAGYGIEKGSLSLQVHYKLDNGRLEAQNKLYLDQLTFGGKVDSPDALKLPVLLAVSLLKDRHGVIDIDLPIRGSLDDPQFSIGGIIVRVIVNLLTKAVTAPFSLLASAFGGGEELGHVDFAPGSSELDDAARARLDKLAQALADRPALRLEATGQADPAVDEAALRRRHVDGLLRQAKARERGELPDGVTIEPAERARWLQAAYKAADLPAKPRNVLGLARSLPPPEMEALLLDAAPVGEAALRALADQRGDRVKAYLVGKIAPERVLLSASRVGGAADAGSRADGADGADGAESAANAGTSGAAAGSMSSAASAASAASGASAPSGAATDAAAGPRVDFTLK